MLHTLGLVLALISVAVSAVWGSLEAWWLWVVGPKGWGNEVSLKGQEIRSARDDVMRQSRDTGCPLDLMF